MTARVAPLTGQELMVVPGIDEGYVPAENYRQTEDIEEATVVTSAVAGTGRRKHRIVLDIDHEAKLIPSSTPGHFHLYIDHEVEWDDYENVLHALGSAGVIEEGYVGASIARGFTAARLPWVRKGEPSPEPHPVLF